MFFVFKNLSEADYLTTFERCFWTTRGESRALPTQHPTCFQTWSLTYFSCSHQTKSEVQDRFTLEKTTLLVAGHMKCVCFFLLSVLIILEFNWALL